MQANILVIVCPNVTAIKHEIVIMITGRTVGQHYSPHFWAERNWRDLPRLCLTSPVSKKSRQGRQVALAYPTTAGNPPPLASPPPPPLASPPCQKKSIPLPFCLFIFTYLVEDNCNHPALRGGPRQHFIPQQQKKGATANTS